MVRASDVNADYLCGMRNRRPATALLLAMLIVSGCTPLVGGPCEYQTSVELARVEKAGADFKLHIVKFGPGERDLVYPFAEAAKHQANPPAAKAGDIWHVLMKRETRGTCVPLSVSLFQRASADASRHMVYLPADSSEPNIAEKNMIAAFAQQHVDCRFEVQGHSDEIGSREYNLAKSGRMADRVAQLIQSNGIAPDHLKIISFGEGRPQNTSQDADIRHALNRRVEIIARCKKQR